MLLPTKVKAPRVEGGRPRPEVIEPEVMEPRGGGLGMDAAIPALFDESLEVHRAVVKGLLANSAGSMRDWMPDSLFYSPAV
jgi:hypothetical protein